MSDYSVQSESIVHTSGRRRGGTMTAEELAERFNTLTMNIHQVQVEQQEKKRNDELRSMMSSGGDTSGLIAAIRNGQLNEVSLKKHANM